MRTKVLTIIISLSFLINAYAQEQSKILGLKEALQMGTDSSKLLKISTAKMQLAEAKYNQALDAILPSVRITAGYTRLSDIDPPKFLFPGASEPVSLFPVYVNNFSAGLSVSETIFSGFRLKYAKESQKLLRDAAKSDDVANKTETEFAIINAFFNLYKLQVSLKVVEENLSQIYEKVRETELMTRNGLSTKNDVLRWQLQQSNLELTKLDISNNISIANYNFNLMLGLNGDVKIIPDSNDVNVVLNQKSFGDYLALGLEKRNDLVATNLRTNASKNSLKVAKNSYLPRISLNGEFLDAKPNNRYIPPVNDFKTTWSAGINFNWDIITLYTNKHTVDEAQSLYQQSSNSYLQLTDEIKSEINRNYLLLNEAIQKGNVMKKSVEQATENYRLMESRYKNSLVVLSELLDANNQLLTSQINYSFTKADIQTAYYRLLKSTGSLN